MVWLKAEVEFASTFSYRLPDLSSQYAYPALLPGPSTIKLGLVATAISHFKSVAEGERIFDTVKHGQICFEIPNEIAVFHPFIKRLKAKKEGGGFESTYGIRGFVIYSGPLILYLGFNSDDRENEERIKQTLRCIRRLGTSDSLLVVKKVTYEAPDDPHKLTTPLESIGERVEGLVQRVKDFVSDVNFEDVNIYAKREREKECFVDKFYVVPVKPIKAGGNWVLYRKSG